MEKKESNNKTENAILTEPVSNVSSNVNSNAYSNTYNNSNPNRNSNNLFNRNNNYNRNKNSNERTFNILQSNNNSEKSFCGNCGKMGHTYRKCSKPIISLGVILCKNNIPNTVKPVVSNIPNKIVKNSYSYSQTDVDRSNSNKNKFKKYPNKSYSYKKYDSEDFLINNTNDTILLIKRKDTIGYVEFMRGKYDLQNKKYIIKLFELMTEEEKKRLLEVNDFDTLRDMMGMNKNARPYKNEYDIAKLKFNDLRDGKFGYNLEAILNETPNIWDEAEWGLPKGRRHLRESDKDCAIREFKEESGFNDEDFILMENVKPLEEVYTGINGIRYKHIYFFAKCITDKLPSINPDNFAQTTEIGAIGWFFYKDAMKKIRPYHREKINVVRKSFIMMRAKNKYFDEFLLNKF